LEKIGWTCFSGFVILFVDISEHPKPGHSYDIPLQALSKTCDNLIDYFFGIEELSQPPLSPIHVFFHILSEIPSLLVTNSILDFITKGVVVQAINPISVRITIDPEILELIFYRQR
jgi:hypothetical protein